ncbi:hypothetical protein N7491_010006, partial [Penicillium cf. griseofulvum]
KYRKIASYLRSEKGKKVEITNFLQKEEDKLEDKPGDTIEVIIEDKPEDIPDERPLPTNTSIREKT